MSIKSIRDCLFVNFSAKNNNFYLFIHSGVDDGDKLYFILH